MLSRKNNDKVGVKAYIKENDVSYCGLLKPVCVSDRTTKTNSLNPLICNKGLKRFSDSQNSKKLSVSKSYI